MLTRKEGKYLWSAQRKVLRKYSGTDSQRIDLLGVINNNLSNVIEFQWQYTLNFCTNYRKTCAKHFIIQYEGTTSIAVYDTDIAIQLN